MTDGRNIELCSKLRAEYGNAGTMTEDTERKKDDIFSLFLYGLRAYDTRLTRTCLEIIGDAEDGNERRNDWKSIVVSYTAFGKALKMSEETLLVDDLLEDFNPFFLTPEELVSVLEGLGSNERTSPGGFLLECIASFDDAGEDIIRSDDFSETDLSLSLIDGVRDYFSSWINDALSLIVKDGDRLISRDRENIIDFLTREESGHLVDPRYYNAFDALFPLYLSSSTREQLEDDLPVIIEASLRAPDDHVFREAVRAADERGIDWHVNCYPPYSGEILSGILKREKLLPGTEEGRRAFIHMVRTYNPDEEIIQRTIRPSYYYRYDDVSPMTAAVMNPVFPPDKYILLMFTPDDINLRRGLTPLGYAYLRGDRDAAEILIALGADPEWKDERENNTVHYLLSLEDVNLERIITIVPPSLLGERNSDGRTPLDCYFDNEKIDFGGRWNSNRFVSGMYWPYEAFRDNR